MAAILLVRFANCSAALWGGTKASMTRAAITAEQRAAYKTRADKMQETLARIEKLESWRGKTFRCELGGGQAFQVVYDATAQAAWRIGIDTLIAQLEQELADLDRPKELPGLLKKMPGAHVVPCVHLCRSHCVHLCRSHPDDRGNQLCFDCGEALEPAVPAVPAEVEG
jgi:hypothetical protein